MRVAGAEAAFSTPAAAFDPASDLWETYECPAGSLVLFTEATSHSGQPWTNAARDRCAVFHAYNALNPRWTLSRPSDAQARRNNKLRLVFCSALSARGVDSWRRCRRSARRCFASRRPRRTGPTTPSPRPTPSRACKPMVSYCERVAAGCGGRPRCDPPGPRGRDAMNTEPWHAFALSSSHAPWRWVDAAVLGLQPIIVRARH